MRSDWLSVQMTAAACDGRSHGIIDWRGTRGFRGVETAGRFKGFCDGNWLLGPEGVPGVPVGDPVYESVQHVPFALVLGK